VQEVLQMLQVMQMIRHLSRLEFELNPKGCELGAMQNFQ